MTSKKECCCNQEICDPCISGAVIDSDAGCCHGPSESLVLEIERPQKITYSSNCCQLSPPEGAYDCALFCCRTTEYAAPAFRTLYTYRDRYFLVNVPAISQYTPFGTKRCSACDESATATDCCGTGFPPYANCACDPDDVGHNLSPWQKSWMEAHPSHWWLVDILCHAGGAIVLCDGWQPDPLCEYSTVYPGTLYKHLIAVVHPEHWWTFDDCPSGQNPSPQIRIPNTPNELSPQCVVPKHFIYACSGVPLFDFDLDDAVNKDVITDQNRCDLVAAIGSGNDPPQLVLKKLFDGGYLKAKDWREEARQELIDLKALFPAAYAGCTVPACEDMAYLGPVRKRYFEFCDGTWKRLDPLDARDSGIQLPADCIVDPWSGVYPEPGDEDYEDFVFWAERQWVYFHARPGGWDWACWDGYTEDQIPNIDRRDSDICGGDCLNVTGFPQDYITEDCDAGEGTDATCEDCTNIIVRPCGSISVCPEIGCSDQDYCNAFPENGGGMSSCQPVMIAASCDGLHFVHGRVDFDDSGALSDCAGVGWRHVPKCTVFGHSYLYGIGRNCGAWEGTCPHECNRVNKISVSNNVPNVYDSLVAYRSICAAINQGCADAIPCCGTFCLAFENESETLDPCCEEHIIKPACEADPPADSTHPCL